jgi:hypothetical protein
MDGALERALGELPDGGGPAAGWQERVLARIADPEPPARPVRWAVALVAVGALAGLSIAFILVAHRGADDRRPPSELPAFDFQSAADELRAAIDRKIAQIDASYQRLLAARTDEEKASATRELEQKKEELRRKRVELAKLREVARRVHGGGGAVERTGGDTISLKCDPNDPLCGVK